jgi:hypothetical protein
MRELDRLFELFDDFFLLLLGSLLLFNILCVHLEIKKSAQCLYYNLDCFCKYHFRLTDLIV